MHVRCLWVVSYSVAASFSFAFQHGLLWYCSYPSAGACAESVTSFALYFFFIVLVATKLSFQITDMDGSLNDTSAMDVFVCVISGAIGGLVIGLVTEYYTSHSYAPVREVRSVDSHVVCTYSEEPLLAKVDRS